MSIPNFGAHVIKMHEGRDELFETEYLVSYRFRLVCNTCMIVLQFFSQSISKEPQKSHAVADIVVNKLRNRFGNIFPCELSCICAKLSIKRNFYAYR